jgi:hypothetical protein
LKSKLICIFVVILSLLLTGCFGLFGGGTESQIEAVITKLGNYFKAKDTDGLATLYNYPVEVKEKGNLFNTMENAEETAEFWGIFLENFKTIQSVSTFVTDVSQQQNTAKAKVVFLSKVTVDGTDDEGNPIDIIVNFNLIWDCTFEKVGNDWKIVEKDFLAYSYI